MEDTNTQKQTPETLPNETRVTDLRTETTSYLPLLLGVLLIALVLILGGLYLWGASLSKNLEVVPAPNTVNNEPETPRAQADVQIIQTVSSSNSIEAIEADLESTNLDAYDSEINTMERELDRALNAQ